MALPPKGFDTSEYLNGNWTKEILAWPRQHGKSHRDYLEKIMGRRTYNGMHEIHPLMSMPIPVHAGGFKSDTVTLQHHGWQFYVNHDMHSMSVILAMEYRNPRMQALSFHNRIDDYRWDKMHSSTATAAMHSLHNIPPFEIDQMAPNVVMTTVREPDGRYYDERYWRGRQFYPVNMEPVSREEWIDTFHSGTMGGKVRDSVPPVPLEMLLFRPDDRYVKHDIPDVLIKEQSVDELLGMIKERFVDSDQEYYESQGSEQKSRIITDQREIGRHLHLVGVK